MGLYVRFLRVPFEKRLWSWAREAEVLSLNTVIVVGHAHHLDLLLKALLLSAPGGGGGGGGTVRSGVCTPGVGNGEEGGGGGGKGGSFFSGGLAGVRGYLLPSNLNHHNHHPNTSNKEKESSCLAPSSLRTHCYTDVSFLLNNTGVVSLQLTVDTSFIRERNLQSSSAKPQWGMYFPSSSSAAASSSSSSSSSGTVEYIRVFRYATIEW